MCAALCRLQPQLKAPTLGRYPGFWHECCAWRETIKKTRPAPSGQAEPSQATAEIMPEIPQNMTLQTAHGNRLSAQLN